MQTKDESNYEMNPKPCLVGFEIPINQQARFALQNNVFQKIEENEKNDFTYYSNFKPFEWGDCKPRKQLCFTG